MSIVKGAIRPDLLREETLADMYRASAGVFTTKTALIFGDRSITYAELDKWSDTVAKYISSQGIGRGDFVGLWWTRSLEMHIAILGIVKSGAAYVPIDREMPIDRVNTVLVEVGAKACFSDTDAEIACQVLKVPSLPYSDISIEPTMGPLPDSIAYVLYTSGSTGKPKGIPITHRQICHLVRSEQSLLQIKSDDRVYQGFSVSFDMWCEETWIGLHAGATLWVADATTAKVVDELGEVLRAQQITVLHAVPSLLAVMDDNIPTIRIVNAGGEACTPQVLARWATGNRQFYNSYGPTETTVSATFASLRAGDHITIGQPLPNYNLAVIDEHCNLLPYGEKGELIITGPGLSNGYLQRAELTSEKFLAKPEAWNELPGNRLYKTGDAAIINSDGSIEFQGRLDDQIKLRGFRIELGEIESQLNEQPHIVSAAVAVRKDTNGQEELVGYVMLQEGSVFDEATLRGALAKVLPVYMVPSMIVEMKTMPRLPSGKIARKELPTPDSFLKPTSPAPAESIDVTAPIGDRVISVLKQIFVGRDIQLNEDFFTDLGGHSLLAAAFVSRLRRDANVKHASLRDVYVKRPLSELVKQWEVKEEENTASVQRPFYTIPSGRYIVCWIAQSVALLFIYGLFAMQIFLPYLGYYYIQTETTSHGYALLASLCLFCIMPPLFSVLSLIVKWLTVGKFKEGDYPLWGVYYFKWWLVNTMQGLVPLEFLNGTPLFPLYLRLMGVKVADNAQLASLHIGAEDLVTIGSDVSISSQVSLNNAVVEGGMLKLSKIVIGDHAYIGSSAVIAGNTTIEAWGELKDLSFLPSEHTIKTREVWQGSPAQCIAIRSMEELPQPLDVSAHKLLVYKAVFLILLLVFPFAVLLPLLPTVAGLTVLDNNTVSDYDFNYLIWTPLLALSYVLLFILQTVILTRLLMWGIKPGTYPVHSRSYIRKWLAEQIMALSLIVVHPIYATVYVSTMFRALGAKIGKNTEISTANSVTHTMLEIGEESFIADAVTLGEADVRAQRLILDKTTIGSSSFVGNSALIPQGYQLSDNVLIGVLSTPPTAAQIQSHAKSDWFGSPAIALPQRQQSYPYSRDLTHAPSIWRRIARGTVELIRILIPQTAVICLSVIFIAYGHGLLTGHPLWKIILLFPLYYLGIIGLPAFVITVAMKWILVGKYKEAQYPMWTWQVWRSEAVTAVYESLSKTFLLEYLKGTPWLPIVLRFLGVKIGKRVWLGTLDITEYDMVTIGDDTALNDSCGPQTHLFEDRVMKVGKVKIGARSSIGARSIILYDSEVGDDTRLNALSLVMKGENLHNGTNWEGSPVRPQRGN